MVDAAAMLARHANPITRPAHVQFTLPADQTAHADATVPPMQPLTSHAPHAAVYAQLMSPRPPMPAPQPTVLAAQPQQPLPPAPPGLPTLPPYPSAWARSCYSLITNSPPYSASLVLLETPASQLPAAPARLHPPPALHPPTTLLATPQYESTSSYACPSASLPPPDLHSTASAKAPGYPSTDAGSSQVPLPTSSTPPTLLPQLPAVSAPGPSSTSPQLGTGTMQREGEGWNLAATLTNKGQTENYFASANPNPPIPTLQNSQKGVDNLQLTDWHGIKCDSHKEDSLNPRAMPVVFSQQTAVPSQDVKEVLKAIKDSGISFSYFKPLLKGTIEKTKP
ncbi:uncharacterized protein [Taeniopygia guttata]|uniref:uncharacterized protein n=1 Tax=Taeniopygia guttata TaxID=59729 RepID=UPI003BB9331D